jgi:hypothetical protein
LGEAFNLSPFGKVILVKIEQTPPTTDLRHAAIAK